MWILKSSLVKNHL